MKKFKVFVTDLNGAINETLIINEEQRKLLDHFLSHNYIDDYYYHIAIETANTKIYDLTEED